MNDDDVRVSDDEELPDAALVRPYVESLGEFATASEPTGPALPPSEQPTALLPRISLTIRKHSTRARTPGALDSGRGGDFRLVDASLVDAPPARSDRRGRLAVAAVITIIALVVGYFVWDPSLGASGQAARPLIAVVPSLPLQSAIPSQSPLTAPRATRTPANSGARPPRTPTPSARSSAASAQFGPGPRNPDPTANLAQGRPVNDTGHNGAYVASNAVDGDPNTYWESTSRAFPQSITVDLGAPTTIARLVLRLPPLSSWDKRIQWISILGNQNDGDFRTIDGVAFLKFDPASGNQATVKFHSSSYRYVRLTFTGNNRWPAGQAAEIELYSS